MPFLCNGEDYLISPKPPVRANPTGNARLLAEAKVTLCELAYKAITNHTKALASAAVLDQQN